MDAVEIAAWRTETRKRLIAARTALSDSARARASEAISRRLIEILSAGKRIAFYWPFAGEYDPMPAMLRVRNVALPVVVGKNLPLEFRAWTPETEMETGLYGIPHPRRGPPVTPDAVVVPTLGFDAAGYRLGYGGGYYDRTLAALGPNISTIGVAFDLGCLPTIYPQPHDIPLGTIVTERAVFKRG
jgi:5-formyltetrahydrofolate cyclo-ligase